MQTYSDDLFYVSICLEHSTQKVDQTHQSRYCYEFIFKMSKAGYSP